ncbi:hypothetical protein FDP41_002846 [Naegleria fowleri]|uniref:Uncharacterized protein n=1 Tax=Naegleria fowleri TaxID=5763 RepID=A0A6A5BV69_NAEFO|nr:uncharacterized protein FDP41_002846 [Naegleria fowleri]KAF0978331.1 hypothetical protein FDP41_002846 [Naegleria fowleri]CAG4718441.1 unnamed protein product [Naegleria fowleri]
MPSLGTPILSAQDEDCFLGVYESSNQNNYSYNSHMNKSNQPPPPPPPSINYQNYVPNNNYFGKKKKPGKNDWTDYLALISLKFCTQDQTKRPSEYNDNDIKIILEKQLDYTRGDNSLHLSKCKNYPEKSEGAHRTMILDFGSEYLKNRYWNKISPGTQFKNTKRDDTSQYVEVVNLTDLMYDSKKRTECIYIMNGTKTSQPMNPPEMADQNTNSMGNDSHLQSTTLSSSGSSSSSPVPLDPLLEEMKDYAERFEMLKRKREEYEQDIISKVRQAIDEMYQPKAKKDDVTFVDDNDDDLSVKIH